MDIKSFSDIDTVKKTLEHVRKDFLKEIKRLKNVDGNVLKQGFERYYLNYLKNQYTDFNGRVSRFSFWMFVFFAVFVGTIASIIPFLSSVYWLAIAIPCIGICCRRLHDIDLPGWYCIFVFFFIGVFFLILAGDKKENKYGAPVI